MEYTIYSERKKENKNKVKNRTSDIIIICGLVLLIGGALIYLFL